MCVKLKRLLKKHGGIDNIIRCRLKNAFTFAVGTVIAPKVRKYDIKKIMFFFLVEKMRVNKLINLGRNFYKRIEIVKSRLKAKSLLKIDKFYLLWHYWDRIVQEMNREA